jgi:hypothetical protein
MRFNRLWMRDEIYQVRMRCVNEIFRSCNESVYGDKPSGGEFETKLTVAEISLIVDEIWPMDVI